jgi:hypothetical protein
MYLPLDVVRRAGDVLGLVGSADRKRAALIGGLNVGAVALAFGALYLGGTIINGARDRPQPVSQPQPTAVSAAPPSVPLPHPAPAAFAATPDAATLFAPPIAPPATFVGGASAAGSAPAAPVPPTDTAPVHHANAVPAVTNVPEVAVADHAVAALTGPLMLTDALLDADQGIGISAVSNTAVAASVTTGLGTSVAATASTATGVAASVSGAVSGVASAVGAATGSR